MISISDERDRLVTSYAYLTHRGAKKFLRPGLEIADLEQVASIGLLKAIDRYNRQLDTPFEAFAWLYIVGELMHFVRDHERLVRPPRKLRQLEKRYATSQEHLTVELQRTPTPTEIAAQMGVAPQLVSDLLRMRNAGSVENLETVRNLANSDSDASIDSLLDRIAVEQALEGLTDVERVIIRGLYENGLSQAEIARRIGYSPRHVSRLHRIALEKLAPVCCPD